MALRTQHYLGVLLSLSLAINLFVGGAFVGGWLADAEAPVERVRLNEIVADLPSTVRDEAQSALSLREADLALRLAALREARDGAQIALIAEPFFADRLEAGLADVRARGGDVQAALHEVVVDMVEELDASDRATLADLLFAGAGQLNLATRSEVVHFAAVER